MVDSYTKTILTVIAVALCAIALILALANTAFRAPTFGDFVSLRDIADSDERQAKRVSLVKRLPLVRVQGGQVDAQVSGSVEIDR